MARSGKWLLGILGFLLIALCLSALALGDLRKSTLTFGWIFAAAFLLYGVACWEVLQAEKIGPAILIGIFALAAGMLAILIFTRPTLSDDMYRYIWDGRVQAHGISPYRYPPNAPELTFLRDQQIYPSINRKSVVTVYPPGAEAAFFLLWRLLPDNIHWFQVVMATGSLLAGLLLVGLLRDMGRSTGRVLLFLWSPLLIFETAHSAHVEGLVLPLLVGAWWARVREKDGWVGFLLGVATAVKFYPALLLPFLWRPRHPKGRWTMPFAFAGAVGGFYLPYILTSGGRVLGFLPEYFQETFNIGPLAAALNWFFHAVVPGLPGALTLLALGILAAISIWSVFHPARDAETALRSCIWPVGVTTLLSQNLFSWYMLWLLPLVAVFWGISDRRAGKWTLPTPDAWTGWWLFCGLVGLSYSFFIRWQSVTFAILAEFIPLYIFLIIGPLRFLWKKFAQSQE
jgi:alpha-1,6-mannosyltransferase